MLVKRIFAWRRLSSVAIASAIWCLPTPLSAQRGIVIDVASQSNALTTCGIDCLRLTTSFGSFAIAPTGSLTILDGGDATFFAASSATAFQVLSGYTGSGASRIDFVDFYQQGRSTAVNAFGNRDAPDFQIQLRNISSGGPFPNLEIAFAYSGSSGVNNIPAGATIGYRGSDLGVRSLTTPFPGDFAGFFAENIVTNDDGLLLGQRTGDSEFAFVVGPVPDTNFQTVTGLLFERFIPNRAVAAVPEPSTWAMMLMGFYALGLSFRRRRRHAQATA